MFFSKKTCGFYSSMIHGENMPSDVVNISFELYESLLDGQSRGEKIEADDGGYPVLIKPIILPTPPITQFSSLEFLERFTESEQIGVATATMSNAQIKLWYDKLLAAEYIDITDPRTIAGVDALIASGLLDESRKHQILSEE